jgi:N-acetylmuramoyl-L-alanine amidase
MNHGEVFPELSFEQDEDSFEGSFEEERGRGATRARAPLRRGPARPPRRVSPPRPKPKPRPRPRPRPRPLPLPPSWPPYGASYATPLLAEPMVLASGDERLRCIQECMSRGASTAAAAPAPAPEPAPEPTPQPDSGGGGGDASTPDASGDAAEPATGEYEYEHEGPYEQGTADCKIIDLSAQSDHSHRKGKRDPKSVYALVLHQMACCFRRRDPLRSYLRIKSHFAILPEGQILQLHPVSALLWASHGFNSKSVAVEFAGNFPNTTGKWWKGETYGRDRPTAAQLEAGRCLVRHLVRTMGLRVVLAHRQSSNMRENDPGPEVWSHVGQWAIDTLGLSDGGPGFRIGNGKPIPDAWRTWGRSGSAPELEGEYAQEYEDEVEGEFEVAPGLLTLPKAIADKRALGPGIYTLYKDGQRVYVGRTQLLRQRLQQHLLCLTHLKLKVSRFHVRLTPLPGKTPEHRGRVESAVIGRFGRTSHGGQLANVKSREF